MALHTCLVVGQSATKCCTVSLETWWTLKGVQWGTELFLFQQPGLNDTQTELLVVGPPAGFAEADGDTVTPTKDLPGSCLPLDPVLRDVVHSLVFGLLCLEAELGNGLGIEALADLPLSLGQVFPLHRGAIAPAEGGAQLGSLDGLGQLSQVFWSSAVKWMVRLKGGSSWL